MAPIVAVLIVWFLEFLFPFFMNCPSRLKHGLKNLAVGIVNFAMLSFVFSGLTVFMLQSNHGVLSPLRVYPAIEIATALILFDLYMYLWHRMNHILPFLWVFHKFHHSDEYMDSTTAFRFHTGEIFISSIFRLVVLTAYGMTISELLLYEAILFPVIVFHHSNIRIPMCIDRILMLLMASPNLHKVHHSNIQSETDSNFGSILSLWDRLFGSLVVKENYQEIKYGL